MTERTRESAQETHESQLDRDLDYKNLPHLQRFVGPQGQILSRRRTGLSTRSQRTLKTAIKRARHLALMPFVG